MSRTVQSKAETQPPAFGELQRCDERRRIVQVSQASKAPEPERKIEAVAIGHYL